jgi:hypothetical protein
MGALVTLSSNRISLRPWRDEDRDVWRVNLGETAAAIRMDGGGR